MTTARTHHSDFDPAPRAPRPRPCEASGCACEGGFRAPKSRHRLNDYYWFCIEHVRAYNRAWDYYAGMGPDEIEAHVRADTTWRRPTWPLGARPKGEGAPGEFALHDPFEIFGGGFPGAERDGGGKRDGYPRRPADAAEERALAVMDLSYPVTLDQVKARYKELAKRFHPDANGGDKAAEDRLKTINEAYAILRQSLGS